MREGSSANSLWNRGDDVRRVKDACDIARVVGEFVALKPKGREFVGLCPFHDDRSPSMTVVPTKQIFHCFVCQAGGDAIAFVQRFLKMEFREALEYLAERYGVELTPRHAAPSSNADALPRQDLLKAAAFAAEFYRAILRHPEHGSSARDVVARRGISPEMVDRFMLGAAPDRWDGLLLTAQSKSISLRALNEVGLLKKRDSGDGVYDALRNRLIFPIHDPAGRVIAFGGRKINEADEPKYLNSPETRLFNKSATLFGLHQASREIQKQGFAIITEGYTDAIACHQAGFASAVATLGTALTREHAAVLRRLCQGVTLLFDGDAAGQRATDRAAEVFFAENLDVRVCALSRHTDAKDPDELLKRPGGAELFREALTKATDLLEYRFDRLRERVAGKGAAALSAAIEEDLTRLVELGLSRVSPIRKKLIIRRLAQISGVDEATVARSIPEGRPITRVAAPKVDEAAPVEDAPWRAVGALAPSTTLLGCILCEGALWATLTVEEQEFLSPGSYGSPVVDRLAQAVIEIAQRGIAPDLSELLAANHDAGVQQSAVALASRINAETDQNDDRLRQLWKACLARARADRARQGVPAHDALARLELKRTSERELGGDRRVLPRPRS